MALVTGTGLSGEGVWTPLTPPYIYANAVQWCSIYRTKKGTSSKSIKYLCKPILQGSLFKKCDSDSHMHKDSPIIN